MQEKYQVEKTHVLYVSLDDYVFRDNSILDIVDEYRKAHRLSVEEKVYLFLDEVIYKEDFHDYLRTGGIPYYVLREDREFLVGLVDDIIYKDIISDHGIKNTQLIRDFFLLLMERSGKQLSINKIANILGISVDSSKKISVLF